MKQELELCKFYVDFEYVYVFRYSILEVDGKMRYWIVHN